MSDFTVQYAMGFDAAEKEELIRLLPSKWHDRINDAYGCLAVNPGVHLAPLTHSWMSPGIPAFADKLPDPSHVGRRVRVNDGGNWDGWSGTISEQYIDADDCAGSYGKLRYAIKEVAHNGYHWSICAAQVEFIDSEPIS